MNINTTAHECRNVYEHECTQSVLDTLTHRLSLTHTEFHTPSQTHMENYICMYACNIYVCMHATHTHTHTWNIIRVRTRTDALSHNWYQLSEVAILKRVRRASPKVEKCAWTVFRIHARARARARTHKQTANTHTFRGQHFFQQDRGRKTIDRDLTVDEVRIAHHDTAIKFAPYSRLERFDAQACVCAFRAYVRNRCV
jgi:hypothetical protein